MKNKFYKIFSLFFLLGFFLFSGNVSAQDSDGDTYADTVDLDDDNDGILDTVEQTCLSPISIGANPNPTASESYGGTTATYTEVLGSVDLYSFGGYNGFDPAGYPSKLKIDYSVNLTNYAFRIADLDNLERIKVSVYDKNGVLVPNIVPYITYQGTNVVATSQAGMSVLVESNTNSGGSGNSFNSNIYIDFRLPFEVSRIDFDFYDRSNGSPEYYFLGGCVVKDTDGDGIPDYLDLDSDNDGCPDAVEGGAVFTATNLVSSSMAGGNSGATGGTYNLPVVQNLGNTVGNTATTMGIPTIAGTGQTAGTSTTANPVVNGGTASSNQTIASGATAANLSLTSSTGAIQWQISTDNITFTDISGATTATLSPGVLTATRYYRAVLTSVGGCTATSNTVTINVCAAGTAAPVINSTAQYSNILFSYSIPCGSLTADLSVLTASNTPAGTSITWHTGSTATDANKVSPATAIAGTTKLYAAFYDAASLCYSPTREITIFAPICAVNDDFSATPIIAGVGGTLPSIFNNDTYNGNNIALLPPYSVQFLYEMWVPGNASVNVAGDGSLTIPANVPPGTYTYTYKICDNDPDAPVASSCALATVTFVVAIDSDNDGIVDMNDLDDDNDGILDTTECPTTVNDFITAYGSGVTTDIFPSDFGLALNARNQNVTADLSAKFGYPANSGAVIVSITNASVHPTSNVWWTKNGEQPSIWKVSGKMSAFLAMGNDLDYYANDSKTIHIYDNADVIPVTVPGLENQIPVAGQWSVTDTQSEKTLNNLNTNNVTVEKGNWRYINMNFGPKSFGFSTTVASGEPNYGVTMLLECDTDGDGIPNRLDLDSDNDGCLDAIEGDENVTTAQLVNYSGSTLAVGTGSTASKQNLGNSVDTDGVPTVVNSGGAADIGSDQGQGVGDSQNSAVSQCVCYESPSDLTTSVPVNHGVTVLGRAGTHTGITTTNDWPMVRNSAYTVLEAKTKGFVITRIANPETSILIPVVGMMVFDTDADSGKGCLKIYTGSGVGEGWKCFSTQGCP